MNKRNKYIYEGPVMEFETCIDRKWKRETFATSEQEAKRNLTFQYKLQHGKMPSSFVFLPGELKKIKK